MNSVKSFVTGSNPKLNLASIAIAVSATAYFKMRKPKPVQDETETLETLGEGKPMMSMLTKYGPYVLILLLVIPLIVGQMNKSPSSSFQARVASAASELRDSLEESSVSPVSEGDFQERVSEAARKLREEISNKRDVSSSASLSGGAKSASSLAAQASAEISRFIADNS